MQHCAGIFVAIRHKMKILFVVVVEAFTGWEAGALNPHWAYSFGSLHDVD